jgi:hypothetical protein
MSETPEVVVETTNDEEVELPLGHQATKLVLSSLAGFAASTLVSKGYDAFVLARRARKLAKQS